ncbi:unnamed protein product [Notodromas monacha]|uniref:Sodium-coupled monocarboxylate transporter 1 n=1 Tax=Notodromas monacha TaxID=399045 RepID=A0A7R9BQE5_9CRUS|nr:unnamed protein product [Notodromas monacha]CAG0918662.1 unnamed protein product [Notodromas monacha]
MISKHSLTAVDYVIFVGSLLGALGIGIWGFIKAKMVGQKEADVENKATSTSGAEAEDLVVTKDLALIPVVLSLVASYQSAIMIIGNPAEIYAYGGEWLVAFFGVGLAIIGACYIYVPVMYPLNLSSSFQYFDVRYPGKEVRSVAACIYLLYMSLYMGVALFAPVVALSSMTGFPQWAAILIAGGICTIYSSLGGLRGVVWTDVFQITIMFVSLLSICTYGIVKAGGIVEVFEVCSKFDRLKVFKAILLNIPGIFVIVGIGNLMGFVLFANYATCDPILTGEIDQIDEILPFFMQDKMGQIAGMAGLFIASLFGGGLSTMSSGLNALASVAWEDGLKSTKWATSLSASNKVTLIRFLGFIFGLVAVGLAFMSSNLGSINQVNVTLTTTFAAPLMAMFLTSIFLPFVNKPGVLGGALVSFAVACWIGLGKFLHDLPAPIRIPSSIEDCNNSTDFMSQTHYYDNRLFNQNNSTNELSDVHTKDIYHVSYLLNVHFGLWSGVLATVFISIFTGGLKNTHKDSAAFHPWIRRFVKNTE